MAAISGVFEIGLSWGNDKKKDNKKKDDKKKKKHKDDADLDLSCVFFSEAGIVIDSVFYNHPRSDDGSVIYGNDARSGEKAGDDESLLLTLSVVHPLVRAFVISVSCYSDGHTLHDVKKGKVEIREFDDTRPLHHYELLHAKKHTSVVLWMFSRTPQGWQIMNVHTPCDGRNFAEFVHIMKFGCLATIIDPAILNEFQLSDRKFDITKGAIVNIQKLNRVVLGLGWNVARWGGDNDLDASCVLMCGNRVVDKVWYREKSSRCGCIKSSGDNLTGDAVGDDEKITVDLNALRPEVTSLIFTVTVFTQGLTFKNIDGMFVRLLDLDDKGKEMFKYTVANDPAILNHNAMIVCKVFRQKDGGWRFMAIGSARDGRNIEQLEPVLGHYADDNYRPKV